MAVKKALLKFTAAICIMTQIVCIAVISPEANSAILKSDVLVGSWVYSKVNNSSHHCRLIPSNGEDASEDEHVLYAIQNKDADFLTSRETELYELVCDYAETYRYKTDIEKLYAAVTMVCYMCQYDLDTERDCAYPSLVLRKGSCSNYSRTVQLLLESVYMDCYYVVGTAGDGDQINHAWNIVRMDDGSFFHCDSTWCDNTCKDQYGRIHPRLKYLLMNDEKASESRGWNRRLYPKANRDSEKYIRQLKEAGRL